jgi:cbb3-type cytochrome oxidase maturation protein
MLILAILIPVSLALGVAGLVAFFWAMRGRQFEDPEGNAARILVATWDKHPQPLPANGHAASGNPRTPDIAAR